MSCIFSKSIKTLEVLLEAGADVNACKKVSTGSSITKSF
jgi:hypothetical protein